MIKIPLDIRLEWTYDWLLNGWKLLSSSQILLKVIVICYKWQNLAGSTMTWSFSSIIHDMLFCRFTSGCFFTLSVSSREEIRSENNSENGTNWGQSKKCILPWFTIIDSRESRAYLLSSLLLKMLRRLWFLLYDKQRCFACLHLSSSAWFFQRLDNGILWRNHYLMGKCWQNICHALDSNFIQWKALFFFEQKGLDWKVMASSQFSSPV